MLDTFEFFYQFFFLLIWKRTFEVWSLKNQIFGNANDLALGDWELDLPTMIRDYAKQPDAQED